MRSNGEVAEKLERMGELLETQGANAFRVKAYRNAAAVVRDLEDAVGTLLRRGGREELEELPGVGRGLAAVIEELATTGSSTLLLDLEANVAPEEVLTRVPGIGHELAHRIHEELGVDSLEGLEEAAHDGRLAALPGMGDKRVRAVQDALAGMLAPSRRRARPALDRPDVPLLLRVDARYREQAERGALRMIAPRRFNPSGDAWLPIMEMEEDGWHFTALYSNTAQAHELGKTQDWVVIYARRDGTEQQWTVVTSSQGAFKGQRVVRGREAEMAREEALVGAR